MTVLMTLLGGEDPSLHIGWLFKNKRRQLELRCLVPAFHILPFTQRSQHRATGER